MRNLKFLVALFCVLAGGCTMVVDDTGRAPEVAIATKTAVALKVPDHPSIEIQLFPNATDEGLLPTVTPTPVPLATEDVCFDIKGNISSSGEKIYHVQGQANYERTLIDKEGESFFCTEEEAVEAGFRKAQR